MPVSVRSRPLHALLISCLLMPVGGVRAADGEDIVFQFPRDPNALLSNNSGTFDYIPGAASWVTSFEYEVHARGIPCRYLSHAFVYFTYKANPKADLFEAARIAQRAERGFQNAYGENRDRDRTELSNSLKNLAGLAKAPKPSIDSLLAAGEEGVKQWIRENEKWEDAFYMDLMSRRLGIPLASITDPAMTAMYLGFDSLDEAEAARKDPKFAQAVDLLNRDLNIPSVTAPAGVFKAKHPVGHFNNVLENLEKSNTEIRGDLALLKKFAAGSRKDIQEALRLNHAAKKKSLEARKARPQTSDKSEKILTEFEAKEIREVTATAIAGVRLLSMLARKLDPEGAKVIQCVFEPMLKLSEGLALYLGGAITTGAFVGVAIAVVSQIFEALLGGPSDTQVILEAIGDMRRELAEFRRDFYEVLGGVDKKLNLMFLTMNERFDALESLLHREFQDVKGSLARLERHASVSATDADAIEAMLRRSDMGGYRIDLRRRINYCLPPGELDLGWEEFRTCLNEFYTCATEDALDPLFVGRSLRAEAPLGTQGVVDLDAQGLYQSAERLLADESDPSWNRIAPLVDIAQGRYRQRLVSDSERIPNVMTWATCARSYAEMAQRWPAHYRKALKAGYSPANVERPGITASLALRRILFPDEAQGHSDKGFLLNMIRDYRQRIEAVNDYLERRKRETESEKTKGLKLLYGLEQNVTKAPRFTTPGQTEPVIVSDITTAGKDIYRQVDQARHLLLTYPKDEALLKAIPRPIAMAHQLGLGVVKITQEASLGEFRFDRVLTKDFPVGGFSASRTLIEQEHDLWHVDVVSTQSANPYLKVTVSFVPKRHAEKEPESYLLREFHWVGKEQAWWEFRGRSIYDEYRGETHKSFKQRQDRIILNLAEHMRGLWTKKGGWLENFENQLMTTVLHSKEAEAKATELVNGYFASVSEELEKKLTAEALNGQLELNGLLRSVTGAKRLLTEFVRLALPQTNNDPEFKKALDELPEARELVPPASVPGELGSHWYRTRFVSERITSESALRRLDQFAKLFEKLELDSPERHLVVEETLLRLAPLVGLSAPRETAAAK